MNVNYFNYFFLCLYSFILTVTHQCICFTVLFSVLVVSDQSAVPDRLLIWEEFCWSVHKCLPTLLTWLVTDNSLMQLLLTHTVSLWIFCPSVLSFTQRSFSQTSYRIWRIYDLYVNCRFVIGFHTLGNCVVCVVFVGVGGWRKYHSICNNCFIQSCIFLNI